MNYHAKEQWFSSSKSSICFIGAIAEKKASYSLHLKGRNQIIPQKESLIDH